MSKSIDALMKELINGGYELKDIVSAVEAADKAIAAEKAEVEKKKKEAEAAQLKISAARDRAATAFADYLLTLGVEEALGVTKDEAIKMAHETFEDLEEYVQQSLSSMSKRRTLKTDVDSDLDAEIAKFLKGLGVI